MTDEALLDVGYGPFNKTIEDGWVRYMVGQTSLAFEGTQSSSMATKLSSFLGKALMSFSTLLGTLYPQVMGSGNGPTSIQTSENILARYDLSFRSAGKQIATRNPLVCSPPPFSIYYL